MGTSIIEIECILFYSILFYSILFYSILFYSIGRMHSILNVFYQETREETREETRKDFQVLIPFRGNRDKSTSSVISDFPQPHSI